MIFCAFKISYAQHNSFKTKSFFPLQSTLQIDSLPINYHNFKITRNNIEIDSSLYNLNYEINTIFLDSTLLNDTITINYKILNPNIKISLRDSSLYIPFIEREPSFLNKKTKKKMRDEIYTNGSFVRNFSNGNNQNLSINTDVDLRISGKISNDQNQVCKI